MLPDRVEYTNTISKRNDRGKAKSFRTRFDAWEVSLLRTKGYTISWYG